MIAAQDLEQRVLLRMATSRDVAMTRDVLERAGLQAVGCAAMPELIEQLGRGAGTMVVSEETLVGSDRASLLAALADQPTWSDVPVLVLARHGVHTHAPDLAGEELPNVTVIERPVRVSNLVSAVRSTLRARQRQYEVRDLLHDLHRTDQRRTEFLATLAHELRNPLAPVRNSLALLTSGKLDAAGEARFHQIIRRQVDHMVRLVDDLMEASRITRGKIELERSPVALREIIQEAIELSRPLIEAGGHSLTTEIASETLIVWGDTIRLVQVFSNLLNNAAKYTKAKGRISITSRRDGQEAVVEVRDNGIGLEGEMLESIFEIFVQAADGSKVAQGGLGIGLTLVRSLVELHGGNVRASSPGQQRGATFTVRLPLLQEERDAAPTQPSEIDWKAQKIELAVLVVDDNRDAADSLCELLRATGAKVVATYSGAEALKLVAEHSIDVAILDIGMPGMDGFELAHALRRLSFLQPITLIALTGWGQDLAHERMAAAGFDHHLLKPADLAALLRLLRQVTRKAAPL